MGGGRPSVPRLAIQMAPFTKLLLLCPCRSLRLIFPGPFSKTGGKEEAPGGTPQLLCGSLVGRGQGFSRAWSSGPHLKLCQVSLRLGPGRETASLLQTFAQVVPAACCPLPLGATGELLLPRCLRVTYPSLLLGQGFQVPESIRHPAGPRPHAQRKASAGQILGYMD